MEHQSRLALAMSGEVRQAPQVSTAAVDLFGQTGFQQQMDQMVLEDLKVGQPSEAVLIQMFKLAAAAAARVQLAQMQPPEMVARVAQGFRILMLEPQPCTAAAVVVESVGPGVAPQDLVGQAAAVMAENHLTARRVLAPQVLELQTLAAAVVVAAAKQMQSEALVDQA